MPQKGTIYRILIASPFDCVKERSAIPEIIYSWNSVHSFHTGIILEPVMWDTHVIPELRNRPQEIVNNQIVDSCDFIIGAFWTRIGTVTEDLIFGTAEELDILKNQGKEILLYFSSVPVVPESVDTGQYKTLIEYKKSLRGQGITFDYSDIGVFREMLQKHLSSLMASITNENGNYKPKELDLMASITNKNSNYQPEELERIEDPQVEMSEFQFETFLRKLDNEWIGERENEPENIDNAKYIISSALNDLLRFRSQIVEDNDDKLSPIFNEALKTMKKLCHYEVLLDGGKSFGEFWKKGDAIIQLLNKLSLVMAMQI